MSLADTGADSATILGMTPSPKHARLSRGQRYALAFAAAVVTAGMVMGFTASFVTLYHAAAAHRWAYPALLPLSVDSGILAYVVLDHLALTLGARSRWLHAVALALAGFTVWANAAVSSGAGAWRVIHAAMPALWVLGVEALRFMWRRLHAGAQGAQPDRIPLARWVFSPWRTLGMRKRMVLHHVTSYRVAVAREEALLLAADLVRAEAGRGWRKTAPALLRHHIGTGTLPEAVSDRAATAAYGASMPDMAGPVSEWVTGAFTERARAAVRVRQAKAAIEAPADTVTVTVPKRRKAASKTVTARERKAARVRELLTDGTRRTVADVAAEARVSESTVWRVKRELPSPLRAVAE